MSGESVDGTWLEKYIKVLADLGASFKDSKATVEYGSHTLLKLICVLYYAGMFAKIAKGPSAQRRGYDGAVYFDPFAGPGLVTIQQTGDCVAGSPIAASSTRSKFDHLIFSEINKERADALRDRLGTILPKDRFDVMCCNCNDKISDLVKAIKQRFQKPIVLAFVDPEGMEVKWSTMKTVSQSFTSIDFMVNLAGGVARVGGRIQAGMDSDIPIFKDFFGNNAERILMEISEGKPVQESYQREVRNVLGRSEGATIAIHEVGNRIKYHVLGYTRESWTGSHWAQGFKELKKKIEPADGDIARKILDVVKGRQSKI